MRAEEEIGRIERELMALGRHVSVGGIGDCTRPPGDGRLERSAYLLLSRIEVAGPLSIGELSDAFGLDASTVNRQTAAMSRSGLVERIADPAGGLARKFRATPEGLARLHRHRAWLTRGLERILTGWNDDDVRVLADSLARLNEGIELAQRRARPAGEPPADLAAEG
ncbi:MarR family winged helix-turn-helix transcriptional regulator [Actinocorallia populi]|uniref:MarR family winged helix-turn-helix transcriptional regulator n=1 Tax=Actinocorallia populi TaxID=2079200 RepID=UPI001E466F8C|nr:MarR family transcriptional regulator [Actinocorallia populi]